MKKLFLRDGKPMIGEFPEEPIWHLIPNNPSGDSIVDSYHAAVSAAKDNAVEAVNPEAILTWDDREVWFFEHRAMAEDKLYDIPSGWTVEYEDVPLKLYKQKVVEKIARLIPASENAQGAHYGDACGICGGPCVVGSKGLYCPKCQPNKALNEAGIVATGIAEAGHSEGFEWLIKTNELITDASQTLFEDGGVTEEGICLITPHGNIALTVSELRRIIEEVSRPSQAERDSQEELWKEAINLYSKRDHSADGRADMMKEFTITRKTKP